jgi:hypothetical protein
MGVAFQIVAGWFVADLLGGAFHAWVDHVASPTHWLTRKVVRDFREHHDDRLSMEKYSRIPSMVGSVALLSPAFALAFYAGLPALGWTLLVAAILTQYAHKYAHQPNPPRWARLAQQAGLFLSPRAHEAHHSDFHRSYGVLNGWSHGVLDLMLGRRYAA